MTYNTDQRSFCDLLILTQIAIPLRDARIWDEATGTYTGIIEP